MKFAECKFKTNIGKGKWEIHFHFTLTTWNHRIAAQQLDICLLNWWYCRKKLIFFQQFIKNNIVKKNFEDKFCISIKLLLSNVKTCSNSKLGKIIAPFSKTHTYPLCKNLKSYFERFCIKLKPYLFLRNDIWNFHFGSNF